MKKFLIFSILILFANTAKPNNFDLRSNLSLSPYHNSFYILDGVLFGAGRGQYCEIPTGSCVVNSSKTSDNPNINNFTKTVELKGRKAVRVANGNFHTVILLDDGTVRIAGDKVRGQAGVKPEGKTSNTASWTEPEFNGTKPTVKAIAAGHYNTILLDTKGQVWGTGYISNGQLGKIEQSEKFIHVFQKLATPENISFKAISMGYDQLLLLDTNGTLWVTGGNRSNSITNGQLGTGVLKKGDIDNDAFDFIKVPLNVKITAISAGGAGAGNGTDAFNGPRHSLLLDENGDIWGTGSNDDGQLGSGDNKNYFKFTKIKRPAGIDRFKHISAGGKHSIAIDSKGKLWATGSNANYALGIGDILNTDVFTKVPMPEGVSHFTDAAAGAMHTMVTDNNGNIWVAGTNQYGQLGIGLDIGLNTFVKTLSRLKDGKIISAAPIKNKPIDNPVLPYKKGDAKTIRIGFIGNSLTFTNDVPGKLIEIAAANGKKIEVDVQAISGDNLYNQFNIKDWDSFRVLNYFRPDFIVLQNQTAATKEAHAAIWSNLARMTSSFKGKPVEPLLYQTWHNKKSCEGYIKWGNNQGVKVAPAGQAFNLFKNDGKDDFNTCPDDSATVNWKDLTKQDDYHPTTSGAYLAALTLYATIFGTDSIKKPDSPAMFIVDNEIEKTTDELWDKLVTAAFKAVKNTSAAHNKYTVQKNNPAVSSVTLSNKERILNLNNSGSAMVEISLPKKGSIVLKSTGNEEYWWFLQESNGRFIGRSVPGNPADKNFAIDPAFYSYGDRLISGIPYENGILPAGKYRLYIVRDSDKAADMKVTISYK